MEGIVIISKGKISAQIAAALSFKRKQQKEDTEEGGGDDTSGQPPDLTQTTNNSMPGETKTPKH